MALPRILRNFNLFVDGFGFAGRVMELTPPELKIKEEEFRAGGMDAPAMMDMGMEALEMKFTLAELAPQVRAQFGLANGKGLAFTMLGAMQGDGEVAIPVILVGRGRIKMMTAGTWKAGEVVSSEYTVSLRYYVETVAGLPMVEIDVDNMKRVIAGVDQLASQRIAIGVF